MFYRYSSALNTLRPSAQFAALKPTSALSESSIKPSADPFFVHSNMHMSSIRAAAVARASAAVSQQTQRTISTGPVLKAAAAVDRTGPGAAPYGDPNLMLGRDGKLIPKLPKGTVVGHLVMGEHGMYDPKYRAFQEQCLAAVHREDMTHNSTPGSRLRYQFGLALLVFSMYMFGANLYTLTTGSQAFPYNVVMPDPKKK